GRAHPPRRALVPVAGTEDTDQIDAGLAEDEAIQLLHPRRRHARLHERLHRIVRDDGCPPAVDRLAQLVRDRYPFGGCGRLSAGRSRFGCRDTGYAASHDRRGEEAESPGSDLERISVCWPLPDLASVARPRNIR